MSSREEPIRSAARVETPRKSTRSRNRTKLSTTVAAENFTFLESMVSAGRTDSIAEGVDLAIARLRRVENRARLGAATAAYFAEQSPEAQAEEQALARRLHLSSASVDFDLEP